MSKKVFSAWQVVTIAAVCIVITAVAVTIENTGGFAGILYPASISSATE